MNESKFGPCSFSFSSLFLLLLVTIPAYTIQKQQVTSEKMKETISTSNFAALFIEHFACEVFVVVLVVVFKL